MSGLAAWLQPQLQSLLQQRGHALLLSGPPGLGQYELALALARAWLCEQPTASGACGHCTSCHAVDVRTHPDLFVLLPETLALELGWPLDEKTQDKIDKKELKPSKYIRVDATRHAVSFSQTTRSRGHTKVILIYPAESLNVESANTLLKTLEEPAGALRFVLATEAAHALLPTIRSRCQTLVLPWPDAAAAKIWLVQHLQAEKGSDAGTADRDADTWLRAAGGRPQEALEWSRLASSALTWAQLPKAVTQGDWSLLADWPVARQMDVLQKICHDLMVTAAGGTPRFFTAEALPKSPGLARLSEWQAQLQAAARTMEHPFNAGLMQEAWALSARQALALH